MKLGKFIRTIRAPKRIIPFVIPQKPKVDDKPIPVELPQKQPVKVG